MLPRTLYRACAPPASSAWPFRFNEKSDGADGGLGRIWGFREKLGQFFEPAAYFGWLLLDLPFLPIRSRLPTSTAE